MWESCEKLRKTVFSSTIIQPTEYLPQIHDKNSLNFKDEPISNMPYGPRKHVRYCRVNKDGGWNVFSNNMNLLNIKIEQLLWQDLQSALEKKIQSHHGCHYFPHKPHYYSDMSSNFLARWPDVYSACISHFFYTSTLFDRHVTAWECHLWFIFRSKV